MAAAGKWKLYDRAKLYLADGTHDLDDTTNWKIGLFLSTSNANTLSVGTAVYGDLTNEHANANGYLTGGLALPATIAWTNAAGTITFDSGDPVWTASGGSITARFAVIYRNATVNTIIKPLLAVCLLDTAPADVTATTGNTLTITMSASGIFTLSGAAVD
jgi:hypothetical protein